MKNFCQKICCICCFAPHRVSRINENDDPLIPKSDNSTEVNDKSNENIIISKNKDGNLEVFPDDDPSYSEPCFLDQWVREDEKGLIPTTKRGIINLFKQEFNSEGFEPLHDCDNMQISVKTTSSVHNGIQMIRMSYFIPKDELPPNITLEDLSAYMSSPDKRKVWDNQMKDYILLEGTDKKGVIYLCMKKIALVISERDIVEKIYSFRGNDNVYYSISSSLNDNYYPVQEDVIRVFDWYSSYSVSEDETNFYFKTLNQVDFKMTTPQFILKYTLPMKLKEWYKSLKARMHLDFLGKKEEKKEFDANDGEDNAGAGAGAGDVFIV